MAWTEFVLAFAAFFASHALPVRPPIRPALVSRLGARGFSLAYSALSLAVLAWLIGAAGRAPHVTLWPWVPWHSWFALALMLPACLLFALAVGRPNPFSFGGAGNETFDPARPGVVGVTRHPLLVALALWALAHLVANGDVAHVLLFASFALFAIVGRRLVDRRRQREMGGEWARLDAEARTAGPRLRGSLAGAWPRLLAGLGGYGILIGLHNLLVGVSPLP